MSGESVQLANRFKAYLIVLAGLFLNNFCNMQRLLCNPSFSHVLAIKLGALALLTLLRNWINSKLN